MMVGQGPIALAVGADGGLFGHFFSHLSFLFSVSFSLGDGPIQTEILSQRAVKPKTTNQPNILDHLNNTHYLAFQILKWVPQEAIGNILTTYTYWHYT